MTSTRKVAANQANARLSTGPKTSEGKRRVARNALRHGLSCPVYADPTLAAEVEALALRISGPNPNPTLHDLAVRVAEAQVELLRVRRARLLLLGEIVSRPFVLSLSEEEEWLRVIRRLDPKLLEREGMRLTARVLNVPKGSDETFDEALGRLAEELEGIDRYERRARSRRKFAIRALDEVQTRLRK